MGNFIETIVDKGHRNLITWFDPSVEPEQGIRILCFSSCYKEGDPMRFRVIDSQFLKLCSDVDYWAYLIEPEIL